MVEKRRRSTPLPTSPRLGEELVTLPRRGRDGEGEDVTSH